MKTARAYIQEAIQNCNFVESSEKEKVKQDNNWLLYCLEEAMKNYGNKIVETCQETVHLWKNSPNFYEKIEEIKNKIR